MLRFYAVNRVRETVDSKEFFCWEDFRVEIGERGGSHDTISIVYRFDDSYVFNAVVSRDSKEGRYSDSAYPVSIQVSPGIISQGENRSCEGLNGLLSEIASWLDRVESEIRAMPTYRMQERTAEQLKKFVEELQFQKDEFFTAEEVETLKVRLESLEKDLVGAVDSVEQSSKEAEERVAAIEREFSILRETLETLNKKSWLGRFAGRATRWAAQKENQKLVRSGVEVARSLLSDGSDCAQ